MTKFADYQMDKSQIETGKPKIAVRRPARREAVRVHGTWKLENASVYTASNDRFYLVASGLLKELGEVVKPHTLFAACNDKGELFVWAAPLSQPSARACAEKAIKSWQQIEWDGGKRAYQASKADVDHEPEWKFEEFEELLSEAFAGRTIESLDHRAAQKAMERAKGKSSS